MKSKVEQIIDTKNPDIKMVILEAKVTETEDGLDITNFKPAFVRGALASKIEQALADGKEVTMNGEEA